MEISGVFEAIDFQRDERIIEIGQDCRAFFFQDNRAAEGMMLRQFLLGKIHRCTVTRADLDYIGSITVDPLLMEAAGLLENEKVEVYNINSGARFATYIIPGTPNEGEIGVNGAAAHLAKTGDLIIIACYGWLTAEEIPNHRPKVVFVDSKNQIVCLRDRETN